VTTELKKQNEILKEVINDMAEHINNAMKLRGDGVMTLKECIKLWKDGCD
jgi:hypothetical protein